MEQRNYSHMSTYVFKADSALDAANPPSASKKPTPERERAQTQLDLCTGLSQLGQTHYEKAAYALLKLGPPKHLGEWAGMLISPGDIAIIASLCALASLSRSAIKTNILESDAFGIYLEHEPHVRELIDAYLGSQFKTVLELLERFSVRHSVLLRPPADFIRQTDTALRRPPPHLPRPRPNAPHPLPHNGPLLQTLRFHQARAHGPSVRPAHR